MTEGDLYGHHEVLNNEPVPFTVHATVDSQIILLSSEELKEIMKESSALREYAMLDVRQRHIRDKSPESGSGASRL